MIKEAAIAVGGGRAKTSEEERMNTNAIGDVVPMRRLKFKKSAKSGSVGNGNTKRTPFSDLTNSSSSNVVLKSDIAGRSYESTLASGKGKILEDTASTTKSFHTCQSNHTEESSTVYEESRDRKKEKVTSVTMPDDGAELAFVDEHEDDLHELVRGNVGLGLGEELGPAPWSRDCVAPSSEVLVRSVRFGGGPFVR